MVAALVVIVIILIAGVAYFAAVPSKTVSSVMTETSTVTGAGTTQVVTGPTSTVVSTSVSTSQYPLQHQCPLRWYLQQ